MTGAAPAASGSSCAASTNAVGAPCSQDNVGAGKHLRGTMPAPAGGGAMTRVAERPKPFLVPRVLQGLRALHQLVRQGLHHPGHRDQPGDGAGPDRARPDAVQRLRSLHRRLPGALRSPTARRRGGFRAARSRPRSLGPRPFDAPRAGAPARHHGSVARARSRSSSRGPTPPPSAPCWPAAATSSATRSPRPPRAPS